MYNDEATLVFSYIYQNVGYIFVKLSIKLVLLMSGCKNSLML